MDERNHLPLGDGSFTIMINTTSKAEKTPKELKALYVYLEREEVAEDDPFIRRLHEIVQEANQNREVRSIMTFAEEMENREHFAREAGLKEGRESEKKEIALKLKASGMALSEIAEVTGLSEEDVAALK